MNPIIGVEIKEGEGLLLFLKVQPGAKTEGLDGFNEGQERIRVRIQASAQDGQANRSLIKCLSNLLGVAKSNIAILKGMKNREKTVFVKGNPAELLIRVSASLTES